MMSTAFDFTVGSIRKKMILYSLPVLFSNILQSSYQFVDSLWVGNLLGSDALGAVTVSTTISFAVLSFIIGINSATLTILSQQRGRKDHQGLVHSLNAFVFILGILTICLGFAGYFASSSILRLMGTPEAILPLAASYLKINFAGIIFLFGYNFIGTVLRALGDSKTPARFVLMAVIINAVLDPLMIRTFGLGIDGAAAATITSQGLAFVYGVVYSLLKGKVPFSLPRVPAKKYAKAVLKLGIPGGLQMLAISSGLVFIMGIIASFGANVVAGFGATQRLDNLIMLPAMTIGSTVNSMAGQNIGAVLWERVKTIAKTAGWFIVMLNLVVNTIVYLWAEPFIRMFVSDPQTIRFGTDYLRIIVFFYPFLGINFILNGVMRASGAMIPVLVLNLISFWGLRYPLTALFSHWLGAKGIAFGIGSSFVVSSIIASSYYATGKWKKAKVFDEA